MLSSAITAPPRRQFGFDRAECAVLAGIAAIGLVLAWLCAEHPANLWTIAPWEFSWSEYLGLTIPAWWYGRGLARSERRSSMGWGPPALYFAGLGVIYAVLQTRFLYLAEHMFFLHRVQHLVLHHLGPFLIALSWPGAVLARGMPRWALRVARSRAAGLVGGAIQRPVPAAILFVGLIVLWLYPPLHFRAMVDARLFGLMSWTMVVDGILFFVLVLDPRPAPPARLSFAGRLVLAVSVQIPQIALGGLLAASSGDLYPWYDLCGRVFPAIGAAADQQLGAFVVLFPGGMMSAVAALIVLGRLWRAEAGAEIMARAASRL